MMKTPDKLTAPMVSFLQTLLQAGGSVTTQYARTHSETTTRIALLGRGFAIQIPPGHDGAGCWQITDSGRIALERRRKMDTSADEAATAHRILADVAWNHDHSALRCPTWKPGDVRAFEAAEKADADRKKLLDLARQQEAKIARLEAQIKDLETGIRLQLVEASRVQDGRLRRTSNPKPKRTTENAHPEPRSDRTPAAR